MAKALVSVVVPVLNDEEAIVPFVRAIETALMEAKSNFEIIFCIDPSADGTDERIRGLSKLDKRVKAIFFTRRVGQASAIVAGLSHASGNCAIVMDVDLQDPPELVPRMVAEWRKGAEIVLPRRRSRKGDTVSKRIVAALGYWFLNRFSPFKIPRNTGDFRLIDRSVIVRLLTLSEMHTFLRGTTAVVGGKTVILEFDRPPRVSGKTKYSKWFGGVRLGIDGIISFSTALLDFIIFLGFLMSFCAFLVGTKFIFEKVFFDSVPPGAAQLFVAVTFIGGVQLFALGVIGIYIGRIFEEVKKRPRWFVAETIGLKDVNLFDRKRTEKSID